MSPNLIVGKKVLITTDNWFFAPDGCLYRAAFGTIKSVSNSEETLGIRTNARSTNWYVEVGNMTIAGCQIHYIVTTDSYNPEPASEWQASPEAGCKEYKRPTGIYNADKIWSNGND